MIMAARDKRGKMDQEDDLIDFDLADDDVFDDVVEDSFEDSIADDGYDFGKKKAGGRGGLMKMAAPVMVLALAGGVGFYILNNPGIFSTQKTPAAPPVPQIAQAEQPMMMPAEAAPDIAPPPLPEMASAEDVGIPQPPANINESAPVDTPVQQTGDATALPPSEEDLLAGLDAIPDSPTTQVEEKEVAQAAMLDDIQPEQGSAAGDEPDLVSAVAATETLPASPVPAVPVAPQAPAAKELAPEPAMPIAPPVVVPPPAEVKSAEKVQAQPEAKTEKIVGTPAVVPAPSVAVAAPSSVPSVPAVPVTPVETTQKIPPAPAVAPEKTAADDFDVYYDSETTAQKQKTEPVKSVAAEHVSVEKRSDASDTESQIVAAGRALKLGRYESAAEMYDSLYKINPRDPRILMGRAVSLQKVGRTETAMRVYDELLVVDPGNSDALINMLGLLRGQYPEVALRRLLDLYNKYPGNASIAAQIGVTQADLGHRQDALRYLGIASSVEPQNAQHLFNMAVIFDRAGEKVQAIKYYEQALEVDVVHGGGRSVPREQIYDRLATLRR